MKLQLNILNVGGHVKAEVENNTAILEWGATTEAERTDLAKIITQARAKGAEIFEDKEGAKKIDDVPASKFDSDGFLLIKGQSQMLEVFAKTLVDAEIKAPGKVVFARQEDGSYQIIKGEFDPKSTKEVMSQPIQAAG
jgi:hypothetical protein